jgi:hypothetical protein
MRANAIVLHLPHLTVGAENLKFRRKIVPHYPTVGLGDTAYLATVFSAVVVLVVKGQKILDGLPAARAGAPVMVENLVAVPEAFGGLRDTLVGCAGNAMNLAVLCWGRAPQAGPGLPPLVAVIPTVCLFLFFVVFSRRSPSPSTYWTRRRVNFVRN